VFTPHSQRLGVFDTSTLEYMELRVDMHNHSSAAAIGTTVFFLPRGLETTTVRVVEMATMETYELPLPEAALVSLTTTSARRSSISKKVRVSPAQYGGIVAVGPRLYFTPGVKQQVLVVHPRTAKAPVHLECTAPPPG
jgi:hypothetical protein